MKKQNMLISAMIIFYSLFTFTAFYKIDSLWGINFLYYLPLWQKVMFLLIGIGAFLEPVNKVMYAAYLRIAKLPLFSPATKTSPAASVSVLILSVVILVFAFYFFRIVSLYHDSMQAVYFVKRDLPIDEMYNSIANMRNKPVLLIWISVIQSVLHSALGFSPYWALVIFSICCGIAFMILVLLFVRSFTENPLERLFLFLIIFSQAINFYYFGYANYYSIIPILIFLYIVCACKYIQNKTSIIPSLVILAVTVFTHYGTAFLVPSAIYLMIYHFRQKVSIIHSGVLGHPFKYAVLPLFTLISLVYIIIVTGAYPFGGLTESIRPVFVALSSQKGGGHGTGLFSLQYFLHLFNIFLLLSPLGIVLFIMSLASGHIHATRKELFVFQLILAASGIIYMLYLMPQYLYAWDIFGWASIGYTLAGGIYLIESMRKREAGTYIYVLIVTHAILYFSAWITLNNNTYAASLNYINSYPEEERKNHVTGILRTIIEQDPLRDRNDLKNALKALEPYASNLEDNIYIFQAYHVLNEIGERDRLQSKISRYFLEREKSNQNTAADYFRILQTYSVKEKFKIRNRNQLESYYRKMLTLAPDNPQYHLAYTDYLYAIHDFQNAIKVLLTTDSLYTSSSSTIFNTFAPHFYVKKQLSAAFFQIEDYNSAVHYLAEMESMGIDILEEKNFRYLYRYIVTFLESGNGDRAQIVLDAAHRNNLLTEIKTEYISAQEKSIPGDYNLWFIEQACRNNDMKDVLKILYTVTSSNFSNKYNYLRNFQSILDKNSDIITRYNNHSYGENKNNQLLQSIRALAGGNKIAFLDAQAELRTNDIIFEKGLLEYELLLSNWVFNYAQKFILNSQFDSLQIYGSKLMDCAPGQFYGYFLSGVYYKNMQSREKAQIYFDKAIELLPESRIIEDPSWLIARIREMKVN